MADKIIISKVNESFVQIDSSQSILHELSDRFTFEVPNSKFIPSVRNRMWDGKIRLLDLRTNTLSFGLHSYVKQYADEAGYECVYEQPIDTEVEFSVVEARKMFDVLQLSTEINGVRTAISIHDYQERAIIHTIQSRRSLLLSPTSSGKSAILYCLLRYYLATTKRKILILVPNVGLVNQIFYDICDYCTWDKSHWLGEDNCHMIYSGQAKATEKRVVISTWQSLVRMPAEYFEQFGAVINDECHLASSKEISTIVAKCSKAKYRHGLTGTLKDSKTHSLVLEGLFGPVYKTISTRELMDQKKVADLTIKCLQLSYPRTDRDAVKEATYQEEMSYIVGHESRNRFIRNLALSLKGNVLILFQYVDKHGKVLQSLIENKSKNRRLFFVCGETDVDDRTAVKGIVEKEVDAIITASYGVFSTGVSIRNIDYVIFASPTKSKIRVLQSIGRGLRMSDRKTAVTLFDIADDLCSKSLRGTDVWTNYSFKHFAERVGYYESEEFSHKIYKIELNSDE